MTTLRVALQSLLILAAFACDDDAAGECHVPDPTGPVPTCADVCEHLFSLDCRVGQNRMECETICGASGATAEFPLALRCYAAAASCEAVNSCSLRCGPDASPVPFQPIPTNNDAGGDPDGG